MPTIRFISKILQADETKQGKMAKQAFDLALLAQGMLKGADLTAFVERSVENYLDHSILLVPEQSHFKPKGSLAN
jgi:hypothetical protein